MSDPDRVEFERTIAELLASRRRVRFKLELIEAPSDVLLKWPSGGEIGLCPSKKAGMRIARILFADWRRRRRRAATYDLLERLERTR